jgi:alkylation response protein AidB-like acyl-CoA dehydrogenase
MDFAFHQQQVEFRDQLRALAQARCTPADLRAAWESDLGWSPARWKALGEMGVTAVTVPEAFGGLGLGLVDLALLLEEAGRSGLPEPLTDTAAVAVPLLEGLSDAGGELARRWLPPVAAGDAVVATASPGLPTMVTAGADVAIVFHHGSLHAVESPAAVSTRRSVDGARRLWQLGARALAPSTALMGGEGATSAWHRACDRGAWAAAAVLVGVAGRLIDMTAGYATERRQFGRPIGSFQAVKHHLAGALVKLEFARPLVYRAAWSLDEAEPEAPRHVSMAKSAASDAATQAAAVGLQVHGALGYTWEHDLHLWMKRAWALAGAWGDAGWHRARLLGLVDW